MTSPAPPLQSTPVDQVASANTANTANTAATRHLCAAAYLDDDFRETSLREVYYQPNRVVAPSYGFELLPVLWHCLRARKVIIICDAIVVGVLVLALCAAYMAVFGVIGLLLQMQYTIAIGRFVRDVVRRVRAREPEKVKSNLVFRFMLLVGFTFLWLGAVGILILLSALGDDVNSGSTSQERTGLGLTVSLAIFVIAVTLSVVPGVWRLYQAAQFTPGNIPSGPPRSKRFDGIFAQQQGNTTAYSGYNPFIGSGKIVDTWGFAQRLVRSDPGSGDLRGEREREFETAPFTAQQIVDYVSGRVGALAVESDPEQCIPGLTVEDRVALAGTEVSHLGTETPADALAEIIRQPVSPARHYLACQVVSWRGELVTSVYIHFAVQGRSLYLEITTAALPPCDERYRIVDQVDGTNSVGYLRLFWRGILQTPRTVGIAPFRLARAAVDAILAAVQTVDSRIQVARGFDYGARVSVRELGSAELTRNHIQTQDIIKHKRLIERRVVGATLDFLEARGVDTSEHRQRTLTILNAGAVNTGSGSMTVETAVGQQNNGF